MDLAKDTHGQPISVPVSPANRRHYERQRIRLDAQVKGPEGEPFACEVRDYCAGGLLFYRKGPPRGKALQKGEIIEMRARALTAQGERSICLKARIAWIADAAFGAEFQRPSDKLVSALAEHKRLVHSRTRSARDLDDRRRDFLQQFQGTATAHLQRIYHDILTAFHQRLAAELTSPNVDAAKHQMYVDLKAAQADVTERASGLTQQVFASAMVMSECGVAQAPDAQMRDLSLLELDEFERWLESTKVTTELEAQFASALGVVGRALTADQGTKDDGAIAQAPFNPGQLVAALVNFSKQVEIGELSRQLLFQVAKQHLSEHLAPFYGAMLAKLSELGYSLGARDTRERGAAVQSTPRQSAPQPVESGSPAPPASVKPSPEHSTVDSQPTEIVTAQTAQNTVMADELVHYVARDSGAVLPRSPNWLEAIEGRLSREMAADSRLLQHPNHPLRAIVDALDHLMIFTSAANGDAQANAELRGEVESWLARLEHAPADSPAARDIAEDIGRRVEKLSGQYQRNVERVVAASDGREKLRSAREQVAAELNGRYLGKPVPEVALELLTVGWQAVLELSLLRHGEDSDLYQRRLALYDATIAKLGGEAHEPERRIVPVHRLFDSLKEPLEGAAFDTLKRHAVEKRLQAELNTADKGAIVLKEFPRVEFAVEPPAVERPDGLTSKAWRDILCRVDELEIGDQLLIKDPEHGDHAARLAWVSRDASWLTLVDSRGFYLKDLSASALGLDLHRGLILHEPAPTQPISERAVNAMLARMERKLQHHASHDSLTGLLNRQQFQVKLEAQCGANKDVGGPKVLIWIDIDNFCLINDIHGYGAGDSYLVALARLLEATLGDGVLLGHLGGDRFAALLSRTDVADGVQEARALCAEIAKIPSHKVESSLVITASIGVVGLDDLDAGLQQLLQAAESAARAAKAAGGNQAVQFNGDAPGLSRHRRALEWVVQVDDALANGELKLRCQPIVPIDKTRGLASHYEVLLGVKNSDGELLPIGEFISAAERYQRMGTLDRWITRTVFEWIERQRERMDEFSGFAINLSGQTITDPSFLEFVRDLFARHPILPHWVSFEVTETAAVSDLTIAAEIIKGIKGLGCHVALDDFGSGTASYAYLRELPVDFLKIDGVFVRNIAKNADDRAVVKSINDIGHFLGKQTIAEYVLDDAVLQHVVELGVDYAQGYAISPPILMDSLLT